MDEARDGQAVLGLVVEDAVAAGDEGARLINLLIAAPEDLMHRVLGHILRHAHDVQSQLGVTAHGVDIRQGVGGCDLAEGIGIVGNGREKVQRLHQRQLVRYLIHRGVVALIKAHQQIGILVDLDTLQQLRQHTGAHLGAAAGALGQLRQFYILFHVMVPPSISRTGPAPPPAHRRLRPAPCPIPYHNIPVCHGDPHLRPSSPGTPASPPAGCPAARR